MADLFLELNGLELVATDADCVVNSLKLAGGELAEDGLAAWIEAHSTSL